MPLQILCVSNGKVNVKVFYVLWCIQRGADKMYKTVEAGTACKQWRNGINLNGRKRDREKGLNVITNGLGSACRAPSHCQIPDIGRVLEARTNGKVRKLRLCINWWSLFSVSNILNVSPFFVWTWGGGLRWPLINL